MFSLFFCAHHFVAKTHDVYFVSHLHSAIFCWCSFFNFFPIIACHMFTLVTLDFFFFFCLFTFREVIDMNERHLICFFSILWNGKIEKQILFYFVKCAESHENRFYKYYFNFLIHVKNYWTKRKKNWYNFFIQCFWWGERKFSIDVNWIWHVCLRLKKKLDTINFIYFNWTRSLMKQPVKTFF